MPPNIQIYFFDILLFLKNIFYTACIKIIVKTLLNIIFIFLVNHLQIMDIIFLKKLFKDNRIIHISDPACDVYNIADGKPENFKSLFKLLYLKLLFGKDYVYGDTGRLGFKSFFKISEEFYSKIVDKILKDERDKIQKDFSYQNFQ